MFDCNNIDPDNEFMTVLPFDVIETPVEPVKDDDNDDDNITSLLIESILTPVTPLTLVYPFVDDNETSPFNDCNDNGPDAAVSIILDDCVENDVDTSALMLTALDNAWPTNVPEGLEIETP